MASSKHLRVPREEISFATNGFARRNFVGRGGYGSVYRGTSEKHGTIAVKLLDQRRGGQGDREFKTEIDVLSKYKHENIVSLVGFCDKHGEKILVYKYERKGSLAKHLDSAALTWVQRLLICLDTASGLDYLHSGSRPILHRDVKSSNVLLGDNWKPKISDFGLSTVAPVTVRSTVCGTKGYIDPDYLRTGYPTPKSDVYSFGVVLWEVLCGTLARQVLPALAQRHYKNGTLHTIIPSYLHREMKADSFLTFANIAYRCLNNQKERPAMKEVVEQLQEALRYQRDVSPSPREVVLRVFMPCENCARKVQQCLEGFDGVEEVISDCKTHKVLVKGENADPLKVVQRLRNEIKRNVVLLSPPRC